VIEVILVIIRSFGTEWAFPLTELNEMLKIQKIILTVFFSLTLSAIFFLQMNRYYERKQLNGLVGIWNSDEAFIFVQTDMIVNKASLYELALAKVFGIWKFPEHQYTQIDLAIFHLHSGSLSEYHQSDLSIAGQILPIENVPYLIKGGYQITGFKWDNDHFVKLDDKSLRDAQSFIVSNKERLFGDNWHKIDWEELGHLDEGYDKTFKLITKDTNAELHVKIGASKHNGEGYVTQRPHVTVDMNVGSNRHTLVDFSQDNKRIGVHEFKKITEPK
jgi:hypothetical protein